MSSISLNPDKMTAATIAIFDLMSDGEWHENQTIIAHGAALCAAEERDEALKNGQRVRRKSLASGKEISEDDLVVSGAKDMVRNRLMIAVRGERLERTKTHHRMRPAMQTAWMATRPARPHLRAVTAADTAAPSDCFVDTPVVADAPAKATRKRRESADLIFGGIPEADGWASAPLMLKTRVHFHTEFGAPLPLDEFRAAMPAGCETTFDETTDLYRVDGPHGTGDTIRAAIRDWCNARNIVTKNLRIEKDLKRRTINDLDPNFVADLCMHYAKYSQGRLRRHTTTLQFHFNDHEDLNQQVFEWILDALSLYDDASGVPFGAFLSGKISNWVNDLNRHKYGRVISDTELKHNRAMQAFFTENGRKPTDAELAEVMGQDLTTVRKNAHVVSTLQGLRNIGTLDVAPGDGEVHLPDNDFCDDRHDAALQQSLLSQIMTKACDVDETARGKLATKPNVLGWVAWYGSIWGGQNKTELSTALSTSMRNMTEYKERAEVRMREQQSTFVNGG